jgi:hypothetical protein
MTTAPPPQSTFLHIDLNLPLSEIARLVGNQMEAETFWELFQAVKGEMVHCVECYCYTWKKDSAYLDGNAYCEPCYQHAVNYPNPNCGCVECRTELSGRFESDEE